MQRIESKHLTSIADLREEHQRTVSQLMEKVLTTEALLAGAQSETAVAATKLEKAEADAKRVKAELEAAVAKSSADASAKEDLAKALRHNAELIEELDSVKSVSHTPVVRLRHGDDADCGVDGRYEQVAV